MSELGVAGSPGAPGAQSLRAARVLRWVGAGLLLGAVALAAWTLRVEFDDAYAASVAGHSTCNSGPCTAGQLQRMLLFAGPVSVGVMLAFGVLMLRARVGGPGVVAPATGVRVDVAGRLAAIEALRSTGAISDAEHAEQRARILTAV